MNDWWIFRGTRAPHDLIEEKLPEPPKWRQYRRKYKDDQALPNDLFIERYLESELRGATYLSSERERDLINAALFLRRPLLITGKPGTGKTSLAYAVAYELKLGPVLTWPITSRSTLQDGLYRYDAIARLQATTLEQQRIAKLAKQSQASEATEALPNRLPHSVGAAANEATDIGRYLRLGPLGTALRTSRPKRPRVLLIDEIDKSDIDLPNDLLHIFEEGEFEIPELARLPEHTEYQVIKVRPSDEGPDVDIYRGIVRCYEFPFVVLTSNGERDFPPAFLRRCLRLTIDQPDNEKLAQIIEQQLDLAAEQQPNNIVQEFLSKQADLATDQLLNAIFLTMHDVDLNKHKELRDMLLKSLSNS